MIFGWSFRQTVSGGQCLMCRQMQGTLCIVQLRKEILAVLTGSCTGSRYAGVSEPGGYAYTRGMRQAVPALSGVMSHATMQQKWKKPSATIRKEIWRTPTGSVFCAHGVGFVRSLVPGRRLYASAAGSGTKKSWKNWMNRQEAAVSRKELQVVVYDEKMN